MLDRLIELRKQRDQALNLYNALQLANTMGKTVEELVELDISVKRAANAWIAASTAYETLLNQYTTENP